MHNYTTQANIEEPHLEDGHPARNRNTQIPDMKHKKWLHEIYLYMPYIFPDQVV